MRTPITFAQLEAKIREIIEANPDFKYPGHDTSISRCFYNKTEVKGENIPPCIFGRAFAELGYPVPTTYEGYPISGVLHAMLADGDILRPVDVYWADTLQAQQDLHNPWAEALAKADQRRAEWLGRSEKDES